MIEFKVRVDELPVVLNLFDKFRIVCLINMRNLVDVDWVRGRVSVLSGKASLRARVGSLFGPSPLEIDEGYVLRDALLSAGVIEPSNMGEVLDVVREYMVEPSFSRPKPRCIAVDTNVFYNMFLSVLWYRLGRKLPRVLVSKCVVTELARASRRDMRSVYESTKEFVRRIGGRVDRFRPSTWDLRGRRALGALGELRFVSGYRVEVGGDSCRGDEAIVRSYAEVVGSYDFVVLTFDDKFRNLASALNINSVFIRTPELPSGSIEASYWSITRMIYCLTLSYIHIRVGDGKLGFEFYLPRTSGEVVDGYLMVSGGERVAKTILDELRLARRALEVLEEP